VILLWIRLVSLTFLSLAAGLLAQITLVAVAARAGILRSSPLIYLPRLTRSQSARVVRSPPVVTKVITEYLAVSGLTLVSLVVAGRQPRSTPGGPNRVAPVVAEALIVKTVVQGHWAKETRALLAVLVLPPVAVDLPLLVSQGQVVRVATAARAQVVPSPGRRLLAPVAGAVRAVVWDQLAGLVAAETVARQHQQTAQQAQ